MSTPYLLVPMELQALVVTTELAKELSAGPSSKVPFSTGKALAKGVHLSWVLPDGLSRGIPRAGKRIRLPDVPDIYLIQRYSLGSSGPQIRSWLIDGLTGKTWTTPTENRPRLTAMGPVDHADTPVSTSGTEIQEDRSLWSDYLPG